MKKERLKAAVEELTAILQEMQDEFNEYDSKKSAWYYEQLEQHHSGLCTDEEFENEVFEKYMDLHSHFYVGDIISTIENLEKCLTFFGQENKRLDKAVAEAKNRVPEGWKYWEVEYKDSQCVVKEHQNFYAPTPEQAGEMCKKVYTFEHNTIDIIEVKEVSHD